MQIGAEAAVEMAAAAAILVIKRVHLAEAGRHTGQPRGLQLERSQPLYGGKGPAERAHGRGEFQVVVNGNRTPCCAQQCVVLSSSSTSSACASCFRSCSIFFQREPLDAILPRQPARSDKAPSSTNLEVQGYVLIATKTVTTTLALHFEFAFE